jgi:isoquinoline 1-oxidoreductase beta subunit
MATEIDVTRREFLKSGATTGAALVLGFYLPACGRAERPGSAESNVFEPNAWLRITPDNQITVLVELPEMGQGPRTVNAMLIAEELEADWSTIRVDQAPTLPNIYKHLVTGGSGGVKAIWVPMRKVGAQAREMLRAAAAQKWGADTRDCRAENGTILHVPSGRRLTYGELVETASKLPLIKPDDLPLKQPADFRLIGKPMPRIDTPSKVEGSAVFGIDTRVPGMLFAVIARCPHFGGKLAGFDATAAKAVPGVRAVFAIPALPEPPNPSGSRIPNTAGGVVVAADSTWAAIRGREALKLTWDKGPAGSESTASIHKQMLDQAAGPPTFVAVNQGDALKAIETASKKVEATYELPFQAHATMEPMNIAIDLHNDRIEVWAPTQGAAFHQAFIAQLSGLPPDKVTVHMTLSGGSFGRRYQWDYVAEAWQIGKELKRPVQVVWTRDDDLQHDFYRQYNYHRLSGGLDAKGNIVGWSHRVVSTPIRPTFDSTERLKDPRRVASQELGSAGTLPYAAENFRLDYAPVKSEVPRAWWRSVEDSFTAFAGECFIDELAHAAGRDPYEYRMKLLAEDRKIPSVIYPSGRPLDTARLRSVLQLAAEKAGWGKPLPARTGRGVACKYSFETYIAYVAQVSVDKTGTVRVERIVSAVDCGIAVNPDGVRAMVEGSINFALTEVLSGEITIKDGAVEQTNFHDYNVLRLDAAPEVEVHIVPSTADPGGMGEPGVPPLAPAVANAVFAAIGVRVRKLPIDPKLLQ